MNFPNPAMPRFGASLNTKYGWNLPNSMLDVAKSLNDAKEQVMPRITAIADKKDPIRMELTVNSDNYEASYSTNNNGYGSFKPEANETPVSFINRLVSAAEVLAPKLMTREERNKSRIQQADAFMTNVLKALTLNQVECVSSSDGTYASARMHGTTIRNAKIKVNGEIYNLSKSTRGSKTDYSISTENKDTSKPDNYTRVSVGWSNEGYHSTSMHTPTEYDVDFIRFDTHQDIILKLAQRGKQLFNELEKKGAFTAADITPII